MSDDLFQLLDDETSIALDEFLAASGLMREELMELVELGAFQPLPGLGQWRFAGRYIVQARRAARLRADFDLNPSGMALVLAYLDRIDALERRLRELECQLLK